MTFRKVPEKTVFQTGIAKSVTKMGLAREQHSARWQWELALWSPYNWEVMATGQEARLTWERFLGACE